MKNFSIRSARVFATVLVTVLLVALLATCFIPVETVSIVANSTTAPIYNGSKNRNEVSLMFNIYEATETVGKIVDELNKNEIKCTFFVGGCWADDNEEMLKKIIESGHELGNHGYFHLNHKKISEEANNQEIKNNHLIVKSLTGIEMNLFAPPSGAFSITTLKCAENLGYKTIMWSKDTIDWRDADSTLVYKRATENIASGDLVLMHPKEHTLKALPKIIEYYKENGFRAVTVTECIKADDI